MQRVATKDLKQKNTQTWISDLSHLNFGHLFIVVLVWFLKKKGRAGYFKEETSSWTSHQAFYTSSMNLLFLQIIKFPTKLRFL